MHSSSSNDTVSAVSVVDLANELIDRGCIGANALARFGDDFQQYWNAWHRSEAIQEGRLAESLLIKLWQYAESNSDDPNIGLKIGSKVNLQAKGLLANWLSQSHSLSEAFDIFSSNISLLNSSESWSKHTTRTQVKLSVQFTSSQYSSIAVDRSLAAMLAWSRVLTGHKLVVEKCTLVRSRPICADSYVELFGRNVFFGCDDNSLWISKEDFEHPLQNSNPYLKNLLAQQAIDNMKKGELDTQVYSVASEVFVQRIESLLGQNLSRYCQISEVCDAIHVSRSTLYRKLKAQRTSFTELVRTARSNQLIALEAQSCRQDQIAESLGFQDISSYYRFKNKYI